MIYADRAATTRLSERAFDAARPFLFDAYGNASSRYSFGVRVRRAIEEARARVARALGADPKEIFFTSGGSEGNSQVLRDVLTMSGKGLITSAIEHASVEESARLLETRGREVVRLGVDRDGLVDLDACSRALATGRFGLVSVMFANNEVGTIEPIAELCAVARRFGALCHTDAVQAVGRVPVDVRSLGVDFLTASAHKFNGPKGVGILYKRSDVELTPMILGGGQERGLRSGTENAFGIVAASVALEEKVEKMEEATRKTLALEKRVFDVLREELREGNYQIVARDVPRAPGLFDVLLNGVDGEAAVLLLDMKGICVSTGSACDSKKKEPSRVLLALGFSPEQASSAVRISLGDDNTLEEAETIAKALAFVFRKLSGTKSR